jgi:hypothetical protein
MTVHLGRMCTFIHSVVPLNNKCKCNPSKGVRQRIIDDKGRQTITQARQKDFFRVTFFF